MRKSLAAAAAIAALTAFAAPASAAINLTYNLNLDGTTGSALPPGGTYGTVNVTGTSSDLHFDIKLADNFYFNDSKAFQAFDLLLTGGTGIAFSNITTGFTASGPGDFTAPSIVTNGDTTHFNYALLCASLCAGGNPDGKIPELKFDITGTGLDFGFIDNTNNHPGLPIYFGADIAYEGGPSVITGNIGATLAGGVPEPATWALFILGFGFVGTMLRSARTRQGALTA